MLFVRFARQAKIVSPVNGEVFLRQAEASLLPWRPNAFQDLAAHWRGQWTAIGVRGNFQGLVKSLQHPDADGWLAFSLERPEANEARMVMCTSERRCVLDLRLDKTFPITGKANVTWDGQHFGHIHLPECLLFDTQGQPVGQYKRRPGGLRMRSRRYYGPVTIEGHTIAELTDVWMRLPINFKGRFYLSFTPLPQPWPAFRKIRFPLSLSEEDWLMAVLALELFYDTNWVRDTW